MAAIEAPGGMGNWENTTYVKHGDVRAVACAILELFAEEGMAQIARPAPRTPARFDPMQYAGALENNLWGVALFAGSPGWTVIKTAPLEVLGERAPGAGRMRLVDVARRLGAFGCQVNLYDGSSLVLVEVDPRSECRISGYCARSDNPDPLRFNGEKIPADRIEIRFELLPLQPLVEDCRRDDGAWLDAGMLVRRVAEKLGGDRIGDSDNLTSIDILVAHRSLAMADGIELYFEWPARDRHSPRLEGLKAARPGLFA